MLYIEKLALIHVLIVKDSTAHVFLKRSLHRFPSRGHLIGNMGCFSKDFHFQRMSSTLLIFQPISTNRFSMDKMILCLTLFVILIFNFTWKYDALRMYEPQFISYLLTSLNVYN